MAVYALYLQHSSRLSPTQRALLLPFFPASELQSEPESWPEGSKRTDKIFNFQCHKKYLWTVIRLLRKHVCYYRFRIGVLTLSLITSITKHSTKPPKPYEQLFLGRKETYNVLHCVTKTGKQTHDRTLLSKKKKNLIYSNCKLIPSTFLQ